MSEIEPFYLALPVPEPSPRCGMCLHFHCVHAIQVNSAGSFTHCRVPGCLCRTIVTDAKRFWDGRR